jgi:hypothetical protein
MLKEADVQAGLVAVERVRVLHDELADTDQPPARPRLVPVLDREVVEDLGELPIALDLAGVEGDRLLVRHRKHEVAPGAILELEEFRDADAARPLPQLGRGQERHQHFLAADRVHLLADDLLDLAVDAPAQRQVRPDAGADLPDEAASDEQLVAHGLRVRGVVAQGRQEKLACARNHCIPTRADSGPSGLRCTLLDKSVFFNLKTDYSLSGINDASATATSLERSRGHSRDR